MRAINPNIEFFVGVGEQIVSAAPNPDQGIRKLNFVQKELVDTLSGIIPIEAMVDAFFKNSLMPVYEYALSYGITREEIDSYILLLAVAANKDVGDLRREEKTTGNRNFEMAQIMAFDFLSKKLITEVQEGELDPSNIRREIGKFYTTRIIPSKQKLNLMYRPDCSYLRLDSDNITKKKNETIARTIEICTKIKGHFKDEPENSNDEYEPITKFERYEMLRNVPRQVNRRVS